LTEEQISASMWWASLSDAERLRCREASPEAGSPAELRDADLAARIRAYPERHPTDTANIAAQLLRCSPEEVKAALAVAPGGGAG
jgi:hypothetical protein